MVSFFLCRLQLFDYAFKVMTIFIVFYKTNLKLIFNYLFVNFLSICNDFPCQNIFSSTSRFTMRYEKQTFTDYGAQDNYSQRWQNVIKIPCEFSDLNKCIFHSLFTMRFYCFTVFVTISSRDDFVIYLLLCPCPVISLSSQNNVFIKDQELCCKVFSGL